MSYTILPDNKRFRNHSKSVLSKIDHFTADASKLNETKHVVNWGRETDLKEWVPVMLLVVMHERHARLVIFLALLIAELANMAPSLSRLAAVPRLDDLRAAAKRAESALARHERRVLVGQQPAHDRAAVLHSVFPDDGHGGEGLRVVSSHAAMADAIARRKDELEVRVAIGDLVLW